MALKIYNRLKMFLNYKLQMHKENMSQLGRIQFFIRAEELKRQSYHCTTKGTTTKKYGENELIVSLTTYGNRLFEVSNTIESIMQGSMLPNKIILWLDYSMENAELPYSLKRQQERGLEIRFYKDIRSYKKYIPTLINYPEAIIVTLDDDLLYEPDLLENLYRTYKSNSNCICASRMHKIVLDRNDKPLPYVNWEWKVFPKETSRLHFLTSGGGTLFPPHCFDKDVLDEETFMRLSPTADDIWYFAMALKSGTKVVKSFTHSNRGDDFVTNQDLQDTGLCLVNYISDNRNDTQLKAVLEHYNLYPLLSEHD